MDNTNTVGNTTKWITLSSMKHYDVNNIDTVEKYYNVDNTNYHNFCDVDNIDRFKYAIAYCMRITLTWWKIL